MSKLLGRLIFFGARHGSKDPSVKGSDALSDIGVKEVAASMELLKSLNGGPIIGWFSSGMNRTKQTLNIGRVVMGLEPLEKPETLRGLGYAWFQDPENDPVLPAGELPKYPGFKHALASADQFTVYDRSGVQPADLVYGEALRTDMLVMALRCQIGGFSGFETIDDVPTATVVMTGHGPCIEMATPDPRTTSLLDPAGCPGVGRGHR
jgi:hypothetical protein